MTDFSANVQKPGYTGVAPTYNQCTATDKFTAAPGGRYMLHYKNGATATAGAVKVTDQTTPTPSGASVSAGFADAVVAPTTVAANGELVAWIDNALRFRDATGAINLTHAGTVTTLTVAIFGPY